MIGKRRDLLHLLVSLQHLSKVVPVRLRDQVTRLREIRSTVRREVPTNVVTVKVSEEHGIDVFRGDSLAAHIFKQASPKAA